MKQVETTIITYQADDGKVFDTQRECQFYEEGQMKLVNDLLELAKAEGMDANGLKVLKQMLDSNYLYVMGLVASMLSHPLSESGIYVIKGNGLQIATNHSDVEWDNKDGIKLSYEFLEEFYNSHVGLWAIDKEPKDRSEFFRIGHEQASVGDLVSYKGSVWIIRYYCKKYGITYLLNAFSTDTKECKFEFNISEKVESSCDYKLFVEPVSGIEIADKNLKHARLFLDVRIRGGLLKLESDYVLQECHSNADCSIRLKWDSPKFKQGDTSMTCPKQGVVLWELAQHLKKPQDQLFYQHFDAFCIVSEDGSAAGPIGELCGLFPDIFRLNKSKSNSCKYVSTFINGEWCDFSIEALGLSEKEYAHLFPATSYNKPSPFITKEQVAEKIEKFLLEHQEWSTVWIPCKPHISPPRRKSHNNLINNEFIL